MKKIISISLAVLLLCSAALADPVDLSGMSLDELVALRDQLNLAIWNSQEWQEVTVPAGVWIVGEDIPAGHWQVRPVDKRMGYFTYCEKLDESGRSYGLPGKHWKDFLISTTHPQHNDSLNQIDYNMEPGWFVILDSAMIFTPYAGKPDLGFK